MYRVASPQDGYLGEEVFVETSNEPANSQSGIQINKSRGTSSAVTDDPQHSSRAHKRGHYFKGSKDSCHFLLKQLNKIAAVLQTDGDFRTFSSVLINALLASKPLIPQDKMAYIYEKEPQPLLHPRRIRNTKPKVSSTT